MTMSERMQENVGTIRCRIWIPNLRHGSLKWYQNVTSLSKMWFGNKGYMSEPRSHSNESDLENRMTKKDFKKLKVSTYTTTETTQSCHRGCRGMSGSSYVKF